ncbi:TRAP transporter large permease [Rhodophyticola sp. CCM32]|uniref:TRAP transporter large permease n=1 Tax=Rhodophyticola sp. CCM32 TaxID=2916397 RepID=UPI00107F10E4|nr:TRAP transporter large permease [Rhodophyticola sp. CCM32]QBY00817.1 TRAP transporter large permease [Rhodophyticola sp. CCM32]
MMLALTGILFVVLVAAGVPIAMVFLALTGLWIAVEPAILDVVAAQRLVAGTQSFPLLAIPLFILTGELMNISGITRRVMKFARILTDGITGGIAKTNVLLSTLLSGMSGSANGDAAMQAKILVPEMTSRGYPLAFSTVVTASSALIAPLIPPGISLILFGFVTDTSIGALFAGAIIPGLFLAGAMLCLVHVLSKRAGWDPAVPKENRKKEPLFPAFLSALPALLMPMLIIVGIRAGIFTPSEAGGLAVAYALAFLLFYREATFAQFLTALRSAIISTSAIMLVLAASAAFTWILTFKGFPRAVGEALLTATSQPQLMLILIAVILIIAGMLVEGTALILVLAPMLMPVVNGLGIEPVHFGVVFVFLIHMGGITPPVGTVMFTTCTITRLPVTSFARAVLPFLGLFALVALVLIMVPQLSLLLGG